MLTRTAAIALSQCRCVCVRALHVQQVRHQASVAAAAAPVFLHNLDANEDVTTHVEAGRCPFKHDTFTEKFSHEPNAQTPYTDMSAPCTSRVKSYDEIPGPRGLPVVGNALKYSKLGPYKFEKILENRLAYMNKYGKIYKERLGTMNIVHLFDPSDLAKMFRLEGKYPSRGTIANLEVTYLKRNNKLVGFAFLDGPEWARQRGIIQKVMMHPSAAARYLHMQVPVVSDFVEYLDTKRDEEGVVPNLYEDLFKYTMEAIGVVCFDERMGTFGADTANLDPTRDAARLSEAISETFYCFRNCMFNLPWYQYWRTPMYRRFEKAANTMREIMGRHVQSIAERVRSCKDPAELAEAPGSLCPFTTALLHEDRSMFEILLQDERVTSELAVNLIMALFRTGIDSTGNALAFFLYNLANNPDKQEALYREIRQVLPNDEPLSVDCLPNMPYLKAALRESFRLHFPVFGGSGRVLSEDVEFSGYNVPAGTFIFANMAAMGRMDEYYPEPLTFAPERWLRDERAALTTTAPKDGGFLSLPFSHGLRACPGKRFAEQGLYLAAVSILQRFELSWKGGEMGMIHMPFTTPDQPLNIQFTRRNKE